MDRITHKNVIRRAAKRAGVSIEKMREISWVYRTTLASFITEADLERDVDVPGLGVFRVRKTKPMKARDFDEGKQITVPARRRVVFDPTPRIENVLHVPLDDIDHNADS